MQSDKKGNFIHSYPYRNKKEIIFNDFILWRVLTRLLISNVYSSAVEPQILAPGSGSTALDFIQFNFDSKQIR